MRRSVAAALASTAQGMLPVFMLGGLAVQIQEELVFDERLLGIATTVFFAIAALGSASAGKLVQRLGAYPGLIITALASAIALLGIGTVASSWWLLVAFLAVGGVANAFAQPAANLLLASNVPLNRQGLTFGIKQAAVPICTLLAGLAVPLLGLTVGWRWAFISVASGSVALLVLAPRGKLPVREAARRRPSEDLYRFPLIVLAGAGLLGAAAVNALAVFLVAAAVTSGIAPGRAGLLLAFGSVLGITSRIFVGWRADSRDGGHLPVVSRLLVVGAVGFTLLGAGEAPLMFLAGTVLAFAAGWGWNGLFTYAVVRNYRDAAAEATGITQTGLWLGGMVGPLAFGFVVAAAGYRTAWFGGALLLLLAAVTALIGRRLVQQALAVKGAT